MQKKFRSDVVRLCAAALLSVCAGASVAAGGPLGIDHRLNYDDSGIWKRSYQLGLLNLLVLGEVGGGLLEGGETRLGKTLWRSIDATILSAGSSQVMKMAFSRERPNTTDDPNKFFSGRPNQGFPSGEVAAVSAIVTPFVIEYAHDNPAVYLLEALPLYEGIARVKARGHWQSDVLAGFALGSASGYLMHTRENSFTLSVLPNSVMVGYRKQW